MRRRSHLSVAAVVLLAFVGCTAQKGRPGDSAAALKPRQTLPIPADLQPEIDKARALGAAIYVQDSASAIATDVLIANLGSLEDKHIDGWVTIRDSDVGGRPTGWWLVQFYDESRPPRVRYEVRVPMNPGKEPSFTRVDPPQAPRPGEMRLIEARQAAIHAVPPPSEPMNTVLLPAQPFGAEGFLIYLLAATTDPNVIVFGKHYRVRVGPDGRTVKDVAELSRSALKVDLRNQGSSKTSDRRIPPVVKHTVSDWPSEAYVFASLFHRRPFIVTTARGVWWIEGDRIDLIATEAPAKMSELLE